MRSVLSLLVITVSLHLSQAGDVSILPLRARIAVGDSAVFTCATDTTGGFIQLWEKDGETLHHEVDNILIADSPPESVLTISKVDLDDSGTYTCTDGDSSVFTTTLTAYTPLYIKMTTEPMYPEIDVGKPDNITITCATNGSAVEWSKNGVIITGTGLIDLDGDGDMDIVISDNTVVIINSEVTDSGKYSCLIGQLIDGVNMTEEQTVEILAGVVVKLDKSVSLEEGETAHIKCEILGFPQTVTWYKESEDTGTEELFNGTSGEGRIWISKQLFPDMTVSTLIIKSVKHEDRAYYNCTASNRINQDSGQCMLRVKDRLAALWPFIGILIEVVVLCAIILICERRQKGKEVQADDDEVLPKKKKVPTATLR